MDERPSLVSMAALVKKEHASHERYDKRGTEDKSILYTLALRSTYQLSYQ
jgi:hypothetical protein